MSQEIRPDNHTTFNQDKSCVCVNSSDTMKILKMDSFETLFVH